MNTYRKTLLSAVTALSLGGAMLGAHAQSPAPAAHPKAQLTQEQRQARHAEMHTQRMARLHDELKITAAQEGAWKDFMSAMTPPQGAAGWWHGERADWANLPAPERARKMIERQKQHLAFMEQRLAALSSFYAVLSPEQQKVFDQHAMRMQARGHRHGGMHRKHGAGADGV